MHHKAGWFLMVFLAGCQVQEQAGRGSFLERIRRPVASPDVIQLDIALLERPAGDLFINKELWEFLDEQVVGLDKKGVLDDNGIRVGQIVGLPSNKLQGLLTSDRSCTNPSRQFLSSGRPFHLALGPTLAHARFHIKDNSQPRELECDQAQFQVEVVPTLTSNGKILLRFTPRVEYGELQPKWEPDPQNANWRFHITKNQKTFDFLRWEVPLSPNQFLVVGASFEQPRSLGFINFVRDEGAGPVQRLLVLRPTRIIPGNPTPPPDELFPVGHSATLAFQATLSAVRAQGPY